MEEDIRKETLKRVAHELAMAGQKQGAPLTEEQIVPLLVQNLSGKTADENLAKMLYQYSLAAIDYFGLGS